MNLAHSVMFIECCLSPVPNSCTKFGSNISYSHWDRCPFVPDIQLMTSREFQVLTFGPVVIFAWPWCIFPLFGTDIFIQSGVIDIFMKFKMAAAAILNFQVRWIYHISSCSVWCFSSVPNLVQISVIVTETDALLFPTIISWRHGN